MAPRWRLLLCWLLQALRWRFPRLLAWAASALYALSDEWHQSFQKTRTASWRDVGIDCAGALAGVLVCFALTLLLRKAKARKKSRGTLSAGMNANSAE